MPSALCFFVLSHTRPSLYFAHMDIKEIKTRFAHDILREEWDDFERRQRQAIKQRTTRRSGSLEDNRTYTTSMSGTKSEAKLKHPIHERFLDMKKNYYGNFKSRDGTARDVVRRKKGIPIHNRIIYGKLNPLSFRLMHELSEKVKEWVRAQAKTSETMSSRM